MGVVLFLAGLNTPLLSSGQQGMTRNPSRGFLYLFLWKLAIY